MTAGFGKWHLTPDNVQGAAGPFDHWPKSWGFDHWWGFLSGAAGQYDPVLTMDDWTVGVPEGKDGKPYYFPDDLTDKAIEWLRAVRSQDAMKPWMMYYSTGCAHAPHHVAPEWADKYKGVFDDGWDALRQRTFARQQELGIVPPDAELTERPDILPAWDSLTDTQKALYVRQAEVYAGYQENADWNVGRLLDELGRLGDLDNTLIFYVWGDNGASLEGTVTGSFNELTFLNGLVLDADEQTALIEQYGGVEALGGPHTAPHIAAAWAARVQHAVPVRQADRQPPRWHPGSDGRRLAQADPGRSRCPQPVHPLHRHRPDRARGGRHPRADAGRRDRAGADGRHELRVQLRRSVGGRAAHPAVLRDVRRPGDVPGRLVGGLTPRARAVGRHAGHARGLRSRRRTGTRTATSAGSCTT